MNALSWLLRHWRWWLVLIALLVAWRALHQPLPPSFALVIEPKGAIVEQLAPPVSPWQWLANPNAEQTDLHAILRALNAAASDQRVKLVILRLDRLEHASPAAIEEIARAIARLRKKGTPVITDGLRFSQPAYLIAAATDEVALDPMGSLQLTGFALRRWYLKGLLEKLGLSAHIVRAGAYKTFAEELVRGEMSDEEREQAKALVADAMDWMLAYLARHRPRAHFDRARFDALMAQLAEEVRQAGGFAPLARSLALVDHLSPPAEFEMQWLEKRVGKKQRQRLVPMARYLAEIEQPVAYGAGIGLIVAAGPIVDGKGAPGEIGADTLAQMIEKAGKNEGLRALVLRLDTPGGSATASERIRQAILQVRARKPVVVSMAGVCASGGYWAASAADAIVAEALTITGSIGVVGVLFDAAKLLRRWGVHPDGVQSSPLAGQPSIDQPPPKALLDAWQADVDAAYERFLRIVAKGRKMALARVARLAGGRIYSGARAHQLGLVDAIGGLDMAIQKAAVLAGLSRWHLKRIEKEKGLWERLWEAATRRLGLVPTPARTRLPSHPWLWAWDGAHLLP